MGFLQRLEVPGSSLRNKRSRNCTFTFVMKHKIKGHVKTKIPYSR